jgi:chromosome segregation ATPase
LKVICETQPERCQEEYDRLAYRMHHIIQDGVADQALFDLRLDDMRVSARVVPAAKRLAGLLQRQERLMTSPQPVPDDLVREIADARQSLKTLLAEQFDIRSRIREEERAKLQRELDRIQQQIQQLDAAIARDGRDRERIIQKQMDEALQQAREGRGGPIEPFREPQRAD